MAMSMMHPILSRLSAGLRRVLIVLSLGLLSACGSQGLNGDSTSETWAQIIELSQRSFGAGNTPPPQAPPLSRAILVGFEFPLLRISNPSIGSSATVIPIASRGPANNRLITWSGVGADSFTLEGGILRATRGTGQDVMSSDVRGLRRALQAGGGQYSRSQVILQGNTDGVTLSFNCQLRNAGPATITIVERTFATTRFTETCAGPTGKFVNDYWRDTRDGTLWLSRQWVGPDTGHLIFERVIK